MLKTKKVVRNNKVIKKKISTRSNSKKVGNKEVKMSATERRKRSKAQRIGAMKRKSKAASIARKRRKSLKKRSKLKLK